MQRWTYVMIAFAMWACGTTKSAPESSPRRASAPKPPMTENDPETDPVWRHATLEETRNATVPSAVEFAIIDPAVVEGRAVVLRGALRNHGHEAVEVVLFPVHDRTPLFVEVVATENIAPKPTSGPPVPAVPPRSRVYTVPATGQLLFEDRVIFDRYDVRTFAGARLRWSFQFSGGPDPHGEIVLSEAVTQALDASYAP